MASYDDGSSTESEPYDELEGLAYEDPPAVTPPGLTPPTSLPTSAAAASTAAVAATRRSADQSELSRLQTTSHTTTASPAPAPSPPRRPRVDPLLVALGETLPEVDDDNDADMVTEATACSPIERQRQRPVPHGTASTSDPENRVAPPSPEAPMVKPEPVAAGTREQSTRSSGSTAPAPTVLRPPPLNFVSPFASLAVLTRVAPVVGAPPVSYVPGRGIVTTEPTVTVPCAKCARALPSTAHPIPMPEHEACACCGRYFPGPHLSRAPSRQVRTCPHCMLPPPTPPPSPPRSPSPSPVAPAAPSSPSSSSSSHRDSNSGSDNDEDDGNDTPTTASRDPLAQILSRCSLCRRTLSHIAPTSDDEKMECQCCQNVFDREAFTKSQRAKDPSVRRCKVCAQGGPEILATIRRRASSAQPANSTTTASTTATTTKSSPKNKKGPKEKILTKTSARAAAAAIPKKGSNATMAAYLEMEAEVKRIKLQRRSIRRRRESNDLRGSSKLEYEMQLRQEEDALNRKAQRIRAGNPKLYDEVNSGVLVKKPVGIPRSERDHPTTKKKKMPASTTTTTVTKVTTKRSLTPMTSSHKTQASDRGSTSVPMSTAKRKAPLSSKNTALASLAKKPRASTSNPAPRTRAYPSDSDESERGSPRLIMTRARIRAAQPIEVIEIDDSD